MQLRHIHNQIEHKKRLWVSSLSLCVVVLAIAYVYFLSASVVHVVVQKEVQRNITQVQSKISSLETDYIAAQHDLSIFVAHMEGYEVVTDKVFIDRTSDSLVMRENSPE